LPPPPPPPIQLWNRLPPAAACLPSVVMPRPTLAPRGPQSVGGQAQVSGTQGWYTWACTGTGLDWWGGRTGAFRWGGEAALGAAVSPGRAPTHTLRPALSARQVHPPTPTTKLSFHAACIGGAVGCAGCVGAARVGAGLGWVLTGTSASVHPPGGCLRPHRGPQGAHPRCRTLCCMRVWGGRVQDGGLIVEHGFNSSLVTVPKGAVTYPIFNISSIRNLYDDLVKMEDVNDATILHNLRLRFSSDLVYVWGVARAGAAARHARGDDNHFHMGCIHSLPTLCDGAGGRLAFGVVRGLAAGTPTLAPSSSPSTHSSGSRSCTAQTWRGST
jgi:hypothetical protein